MSGTSERPMGAARPHVAARISDAINRMSGAVLRRRHWRPVVLAHPGYGQSDPQGWVRVLGRVLWAPPTRRAAADDLRGWRRFVTAPVPDVPIRVWLPGADDPLLVRSGRGGYVDAVLPASLPPGRHPVALSVSASGPGASGPGASGPEDVRIAAPVVVADWRPQIGLLSDIDDTVIITHLPRPLLALWNTFVLRESARAAVPGMDRLQAAVASTNPDGGDGLVVYLSTGPWNVVPALSSFLHRHRLRPGPMLMTDWGPTNTGWFRSGREHKAAALRRLARELPQVRWVLVGDDGQHDPQLYADFAREHSDQVAAVAIRRLTGVEQVLAGHPERAGTRRGGPPPPVAPPAVPWVGAADGDGLLADLRRVGVLPAATPGTPVDG